MRRIVISLIGGIVITGSLALASALFIHYRPYRDLPMMPRPFFLIALSPGVIASHIFHFRNRHVANAIFWSGNVITYALAVFCLPALVRASVRASLRDFPHDSP